MSNLEVFLLIATALALFVPLWRRLSARTPRWLDFVPAGLVALMCIQIAVDGLHAYMMVAYVVVVLHFLLTLRYMFRPTPPVKASRVRTVLTLVGAILGVVGLIFGILSGPMVASATVEDASRESWTEAFDRMHGILAQRYGFTEWKQIDWAALHAEFAPRIAAAEAANDDVAYHLALREYLFSIPDGHVKFDGADMGLWRESIGGGYGLALIELDDGSVIAHVLLGGGPAQGAGMTWGAEILEWGGVPAREAIGAVSPIWMALPPATQEGRRFAQQNLLARAPVGTEVTLTYQNYGEDEPHTVTLTAVDDGLAPLYQSLGAEMSLRMRHAMGDEVGQGIDMRPPEYRILPEGYGYIKVYHVLQQEADQDSVAIVDQAVAEFVAQDVPGIIIDVRGNPGGNDVLVPQMMGHFFTEPDFYEYMAFHNWQTGLNFFDIARPLTVEPREPHYGGPVSVLIDQYTLSSGEGFPLLAQRLPQGQVVGLYGTYGSFGMCCSGINLPGGFELLYPAGQSQDANHIVQLDSDHDLQGGVVPDLRVPLTRDTVYAMYVEGEDVVLQYAIEGLEEQ
jgi:carboxyl-terminal processing protease